MLIGEHERWVSHEAEGLRVASKLGDDVRRPERHTDIRNGILTASESHFMTVHKFHRFSRMSAEYF
jgi:hypothetical protein